jgi:hypothetical protein
MRVWSFAVLVAPLLAGASPAPRTASKQDCRVPSGWAALAARKTLYVIFGEVHGTRESPAFLGATACGLAAKGERLLVAVEHSATDDDRLQAAWALPDASFPRGLRQLGWAGREDGVASQAMFAMLLRLHALRSRGLQIDVAAFNGARDEEQRTRFKDLPGQGPHEAAQAENIRHAAGKKRYDHVLVLIGNLHARKRPVERGGATFEPMAMRLAPASAITSLNMAHAGGSMWNCLLKPGAGLEPGKPVTSADVECADHPAKGAVDLHRSPFVSLGAAPGDDDAAAYDGFFWLGKVTGSPPAVPAPAAAAGG